MAYLVYCIMRTPTVGDMPTTGVEGKALSFVGARGLCAAVSELNSAENTPSIAELLAYGRVVEELCRIQAVIPMRYGCFLDGLPAIQSVLEEKNLQYKALLQEFEGRVEMGVRILFPERSARPPQGTQPVDGSHYLAMRRAEYLMRDENSHRHQVILDAYIQAFSELHSKYRTETAVSEGSVVLSLYFLIPKDKVSCFKEMFRRVAENEGYKTLISGPWPPYNFAAPDLPSRTSPEAGE